MGKILRDIYSDTAIAPLLGFKGGTCALFFYGLTRFSVDLDFDLFLDDESTKKKIFEKVKVILEKYSQIKNSYIKLNTIFFSLSYGKDDHNIKVEVSTRTLIPNIKDHYELKEHLGIPMFVAKKPYSFASKLTALTSRRLTAMRDIYDIWYFGDNNWDIDKEVLKIKTGKNFKEQMADCITLVEQIKDNEILQGLGELLGGKKQKAWVKNHLRKETIFVLKNYMSAME
jgi:predicted nucleotidyltransferase component of viral defense system